MTGYNNLNTLLIVLIPISLKNNSFRHLFNKLGLAHAIHKVYMTHIRVRYQTVEFGSTDVHLCTLRDNQEFFDPNGTAQQLGISSANWSLFGVIWPSSLVLAHHMISCDTGTKRILEVGCGIALSSLLLNIKNSDITATDYHPEVENFLKRNIILNHGKSIPFERTDWSNINDKLGLFDLIIGSDLLYEDQQVELLGNFIERHAKPVCQIILVDPGRGRKNKLRNKMVKLGYSYCAVKPIHTDFLENDFKGHILKFDRIL